jgi:DNA-binding response OmpR family regulator
MTERKKRILLVEDDEDVYDFLAPFLADKGYDVRMAHDGGEGIRAVEQFAPDLVILDLMMPHLDGYDFLRVLSSVLRPIVPKVIVLTAVQKTGGRQDALKLGASDFLMKPVDSDLLLVKIQQLIG